MIKREIPKSVGKELDVPYDVPKAWGIETA